MTKPKVCENIYIYSPYGHFVYASGPRFMMIFVVDLIGWAKVLINGDVFYLGDFLMVAHRKKL